MQDCPIEFIVICSLEWFPHYVNVTAKTCNIGNNAQKKHHPAVKGDALQAALSKLATAINTKYPMGYTVPTSYGNILSKSVNVGD